MWFSTSLYRPAETDELAEWFQAEHGVDISGRDWGTALEPIEPWDDLETETWHRLEAAAPVEFAAWCAAYRAATPAEHCLLVNVVDTSRVQGRVSAHGVTVTYPASRLVSAEDPLAAVTEMVLTVVDKDIAKRGLDIRHCASCGRASGSATRLRAGRRRARRTTRRRGARTLGGCVPPGAGRSAP